MKTTRRGRPPGSRNKRPAPRPPCPDCRRRPVGDIYIGHGVWARATSCVKCAPVGRPVLPPGPGRP